MSLEIHDVARIKGLLRVPVHNIVRLHVTSRWPCRWSRARAFLSRVFGLRPTNRRSRRTREKTSGTQGTPLGTKLYFHVPYLFD